MADATLATIRAALLARLNTLHATAGGPLRLVDDWAAHAGPGPEGLTLAGAVLANAPAALVSLVQETTPGGFESIQGQGETVGTSAWDVVLVTTDTRPVGDAVGGTTGIPGLYALVSQVAAKLSGLAITGLYRAKRLDYEEARWFAVVPRKFYAMALRFAARRAIIEDADPVAGDLLETIHGHVNVAGVSGAATALDEFNADTEE
jgi:hypothetical protein